jgi:uncharacterized protein with GYD domain
VLGKGGSTHAHLRLVDQLDRPRHKERQADSQSACAEELAQKYGGSFERLYWTVGAYDIVAILEAPDDESATALLLELGSLGNVRTTTLRAYDREEMSSILGRLG